MLYKLTALSYDVDCYQEKYQATTGKSDCVIPSDWSSPREDIEEVDNYGTFLLTSSDQAVFETLSNDHIVTDLSVCYNDENITFLQTVYARIDPESGEKVDIVMGVRHGQRPAAEQTAVTCENIDISGSEGYGIKFKQLNSKSGKLLNHLTLITSDDKIIEVGGPVDDEGAILQHLFDEEDRFGGFMSDSVYYYPTGALLHTVSTLTYN